MYNEEMETYSYRSYMTGMLRGFFAPSSNPWTSHVYRLHEKDDYKPKKTEEQIRKELMDKYNERIKANERITKSQS